MGGWYLDYSVSSGPFLRFSMRFEFLSEMFDHFVICETRDPSLTIFYSFQALCAQVGMGFCQVGVGDAHHAVHDQGVSPSDEETWEVQGARGSARWAPPEDSRHVPAAKEKPA